MTHSKIKLCIFTPTFCYPSETFIIDSTRLDPKHFEVHVAAFEITPFAKKNLPRLVFIKKLSPQSKNIKQYFDSFDVIHVHYLNNLRSVPLETLEAKPVYVTCHGEDVFLYGRDIFYRWQLKNKLKVVTQFLCVSKNLSEALQKYLKIPSSKIKVTPLGIDLKKFKYRLPGRLRNQPPWKIGIAARMVDYKGIDDLILAISILKKEGFPVELHILGTGPQEKKLKKLTQTLNLKKEVVWHGWKSGSMLMSTLRKLDVYGGPYKVGKGGAQDSMTMILKEVMALGIPVVSTVHSAIPELIQSGTHGLLVKPNRPEQLAKAIKKILNQPDLKIKLIRQARQHIEKNFDLNNQSQRWLEMIASNS